MDTRASQVEIHFYANHGDEMAVISGKLAHDWEVAEGGQGSLVMKG